MAAGRAPGTPRVPGSGRAVGTPNKLTRTIKQTFEEVFALLQKNPEDGHALASWAKANPGEFYKLAARLLPFQANVAVTKGYADLVKEAHERGEAAKLTVIEGGKVGEG